MGFKVHTTDDGRTPALESAPVGEITPEIGMALKMTGGKLDISKGAEKPVYIAMTERKEACQDGERIPVIRVGADIVFETTATADMSGVKTGDKVTVSNDGMEVTATTGGAAEIISMDGTNPGSRVRVRFGGCADCE